MSWYEESLVYQLYPLRLLDAPYENDGAGPVEHRLPRLAGWVDHLQRLGVGCVLLNPVWESSSHGYDTRDLLTVDRRLGDGDGFGYECWEGMGELVRLNHSNFDLNAWCADVIRTWERELEIDGLRLDVAYCLDRGFLGYLRQVCDEISTKRGQKFLMLGETMFGDHNLWMGDAACDTVTNYETYKGLW